MYLSVVTPVDFFVFSNAVVYDPLLECLVAHLCAIVTYVFLYLLTGNFTDQLHLGLCFWPTPNLTHAGVPH